MNEKIIRSGHSFHDFKKEASVSEFPTLFTKYIQSFGETYFWEKGNFHVVTKAQHAKEVLMSSSFSADRGSFFVSRMPNMDLSLIQDFFSVVKKMMVVSDDQDHTKRRKVASTGFEDHILERFQTTMKQSISKLVKSIEGKGEFDFVTLSKILPSTVLADLFSIPEKDRENFLKWSNIMTGFFGGASQYRNEDGIEVNQAALSLKNYFTELVEQREKNPGDDYVSLTLQMQKRVGLSHDELVSQLIMMLVAGMATTSDQLNNCMFLFASNPEIQKHVRNDHKLIPLMLEEFKRFDPAVTFIFRVAREKTKIGEQPIEVGDVIFISTHAINRDFDDRPHELDIFRKRTHFSYGHGAHYCLGAKLARMEMVNLFESILKNIPSFEINSSKESKRDHYSLSFSGFSELHLRLV